jgi:metal-dependent amidase/aminoacylase/carboxypeptidase family protein
LKEVNELDINKLVKDNEELLIQIRRHIHRNPELSGAEHQTLVYIRKKLTEFGIAFTEVDNGGIVGFIGDAAAGKTLLLRADIDALPILESKCNLKRRKTVVSEVDGVQLACGHDAHTAILLVAGKILKENEGELAGRIILGSVLYYGAVAAAGYAVEFLNSPAGRVSPGTAKKDDAWRQAWTL